MQRAFVKTLLESSDCAGALVAFYTNGELDKWRLSLVRMDYEFSKGKISERLTPAKRYSYLVGDKEPCHTAQERLYPIFVADGNNPSLDELEEAFSVEAVTKDFFVQYREKYLVLKEYLDSNPDFIAESENRGFSSEQFAKKLMGQIVFLYFIQKKGWLGVNAFPSKLSEREYKYAFYYKRTTSSVWKAIGEEFGSTASASFKPKSAGEFRIKVDIIDKNGKLVSKLMSLSISDDAPDVPTNKSTISYAYVTLGNRLTIKGAASGGAGGYKYTYQQKKSTASKWHTIGSENTNDTVAYFKPSAKGKYDVRVIVTDKAGVQQERTFVIVVK